MNKKKTFLVTGATGLIGSRIVNELIKAGNNNVIALSRDKTKINKLFAKYFELDTFDYISLDICKDFDFEIISKCKIKQNIDGIFHAASPISHYAIQQTPLDVINSNLNATINLMEGLVKQKRNTGVNCRIVIFSGGVVYGKVNDKDIIVKEADTMTAETLDSVHAPYSESKRMIEVISRSFIKQYDIDAVIVRPSYVYGSTFFPPDSAVYEFINNALLDKDIQINNPDLDKRDNIYIDDVISGIFTVFENGKTGEAYNISSGGEQGNYAAVDEIAEIIVKISNKELLKNIKVHYKSPKSITRKPGMMLDNNKLKTLGWQLKNSLYDGIKITLLEQYAIKRDEIIS